MDEKTPPSIDAAVAKAISTAKEERDARWRTARIANVAKARAAKAIADANRQRSKRLRGNQNRAPLGPSSMEHVINNLDRRSQVGRVLEQVKRDLTEHVGGDPTAAENLIIHAASLCATRLYLLQQKTLGFADPSEAGEHDAKCFSYLIP
jgi:hypothetical protein